MVAPVVVAAAGIAAAAKFGGSFFGSKARKRAAKKRRQLEYDNIALRQRETEETRKRMVQNNEDLLGRQQTQIGASGFTPGQSSLDRFAKTTSTRMSEDLSWFVNSSAERAALDKRSADIGYRIAQDSHKYATIGAIGAGIGDIAKIGAM